MGGVYTTLMKDDKDVGAIYQLGPQNSGTGQLASLAGKMVIKIADGKHSFDFEYTLAETT